jgi:hypothetical protein
MNLGSREGSFGKSERPSNGLAPSTSADCSTPNAAGGAPARTAERALSCFRQAVLGLCWFRQDVEVTALARDHGVSRATGYRYLDEVIKVLADQAPNLHEALGKAKTDGLAYVILDGKVFSADRCSRWRPDSHWRGV